MINKEYHIYNKVNGEKGITVIFDIDNHDTLTLFMCTDVLIFEEKIKENINLVIQEKNPYFIFNGNACCVEIGKVRTKVYNNFAENEKEFYSTCCDISTVELLELICEWCNKNREFKQKMQ